MQGWDDQGIPLMIDGFNLLPVGGALRFSQSLQSLVIDAAPDQIRFTRLGLAEAQQASTLRPEHCFGHMEAATIDGAGAWQRFRKITFPLLLVAMAPLLVASFDFNFNNFTVIELFNNGGPPISAATVAGHTDILLSYTYRLAFVGAAGTDYGFAAAVSIFIFIIVGSITLFNFRLTRRFEEIGAAS